MFFPRKIFPPRFHHSAGRGAGQNPGADDQLQHGSHLQRHGDQGAAGETFWVSVERKLQVGVVHRSLWRSTSTAPFPFAPHGRCDFGDIVYWQWMFLRNNKRWGCNTLCVNFEDETKLVTSDFLIFKFTTICWFFFFYSFPFLFDPLRSLRDVPRRSCCSRWCLKLQPWKKTWSSWRRVSFPLCWQRARWARFRLRENFYVLAPSAVSVVNLFSLFLFFFPFYFTETQAPAVPAQSSTCCRFILFYSQLDLLCFVFCVVISSHPGKAFCVEQWFVYRLFV